MDLERIKQNLRLRSGRNKKTRKPLSQSQPQPQPPPAPNQANGVAKQPSSSQTQLAHNPPKEEPSLRNWDPSPALPPIPQIDVKNVPAHRPELRHAATSTPASDGEQQNLSRYGRSGIDRPQRPAVEESQPNVLQRRQTDPHTSFFASDNSDAMDFDLRPPAPRPKPPSVETLSELLFSAGHLNYLLHNPQTLSRFTAFLLKYRPQFHPELLRYIETQKAIKAVEYANAVAAGLTGLPTEKSNSESKRSTSTAAKLDKIFEETCAVAFKTLVGAALPMYITYNLVKIVSECLTNEITGRQTALMNDLVGGLSEVFCLTDPKQEDNPIIYASEEFYRLTGYGRDDVIGHNCRFLQGKKTKRESPMRLRESLAKGEETCETLLNYRRDGRPFINLLMIAPLHDNKGKVKYNIGAQVDVSGLIEGGRGLIGFERYLVFQQMEQRRLEIEKTNPQGSEEAKRKRQALAKLRDLSEMFDLEESAVVQSHSRSSSMTRDSDERSVGSTERRKAQRRVFVDSDQSEADDSEEDAQDGSTWKLGHAGPLGLSGKLPGVYDSYMLIRPAPSMRVIFVSPKLRRLGNIVQSPFLSHVAAPPATLAGLKESFGTGVPVSAKINFMAKAGERRDGTKTGHGTKHEDGHYGRACWISATPMFGSDDKIGVWMIVFVEKRRVPQVPKRTAETRPVTNEVQAIVGRAQRTKPRSIDIPKRGSSQGLRTNEQPKEPSHHEADTMPMKPVRIDELTEPAEQISSPRMETLAEAPVQEYEPVPRSDELPNAMAESLDHHKPLQQRYEISDEEYVRPVLRQMDSHRSERVTIRPDSDGEPDAWGTEDVAAALERSPVGPRSALLDEGYSPAPDVPRSLPAGTPNRDMKDHEDGNGIDEATPTRARHDTRDESQSSSPRHTSESREEPHSALRSSGLGYMDYLRHPGSRNSSNYTRAPSGSGFVSTRRRNAEELGKELSEDQLSDPDCATSPYSVD